MRNLDLTHLWRSTVGFDRLLDLIEDQIRWTDEDNYPPYDIERLGENRYQISLALAGFTPADITVTAEQDLLTVQGRKSAKGDHEYLYQGISARPFRRVFNLADFVKVENATFANGLLNIELVRQVPDVMKPRRIAINNTSPQIPDSKAA
jgi:molecular chaperone IbpA